MPQTYLSGTLLESDGSQLSGPLSGALADMVVYGGETFRWKICYCLDEFGIASIVPGSDTLAVSEETCVKVDDCIKIWGHRDACSSLLINGEHKVTAIAGKNLTVATDLAQVPAQSFAALPPIPGCTSQSVNPPSACHLKNIKDYVFTGVITTRLPGDNTRLAMAIDAIQGSPVVKPKEAGDIQVGDRIDSPGAGISGAIVIRKYFEHGSEWLVLDRPATSTGCAGATSEVGQIAAFDFDSSGACNGCVTVSLSSAVTRKLPMTGEKVMPARGAKDCSPHYKLGIYSIYASYVSEDLEVESELVTRGCVHYYPSNQVN